MMYTTTDTITTPPITIGETVVTVTYTVSAIGGTTTKAGNAEGKWGQVDALPCSITVKNSRAEIEHVIAIPINQTKPHP